MARVFFCSANTFGPCERIIKNKTKMKKNKTESMAEVVDFLCTSRACPYYFLGCKLPESKKKNCPKKGSYRRKPRIDIDDLLVVVDGEGY